MHDLRADPTARAGPAACPGTVAQPGLSCVCMHTGVHTCPGALSGKIAKLRGGWAGLWGTVGPGLEEGPCQQGAVQGDPVARLEIKGPKAGPMEQVRPSGTLPSATPISQHPQGSELPEPAGKGGGLVGADPSAGVHEVAGHSSLEVPSR